MAALLGGDEAVPLEEGRSRSATGASDSPAGDREGKKKKGLFGWGSDPEKKRAERAERERAKEEAKAKEKERERAKAEDHARELAEKAERERREREAREDERWKREREAEEARRLEREATERERRRNLPQTSESLLATLCDEAALGTVGGLRYDASEKTGAADTLAAMLATDAAALGAMRSTESPLKLLDALGSASDTRLQEALLGLLGLLYGEGAAPSAVDALVASGGLLYLTGLLSPPASPQLHAQAVELLATLCSRAPDTAASLADLGGIPPLLEAASAPEPRARLAALQLLRAMAAQSASVAASVASAGGAPPLVAALVTAAAEAKGWSNAGGAGRHTAEGEQAASAALGALVALCGATEGAAKVQDAFRAASALPSLVALLGAKDETSRSLAMALLTRVAPADGVGGELVATGGIALLCEGLVHEQGEARLEALRTLVPLAASPLNAVAVAEAPGAVGALCALLDHAEMSTRLAALAALSSLCALGALRAEQLLAADGALGALLALARAPGGGVPPAQRAAALAILAQAALDAAGRRQLVALGGAALFVEALAPGGPLEREADARRDATQALAHLAADESFRHQLVAWGALPSLCAQLASATQPDARVRACALSAVANVSFVDAAALVAAGALPRLAELLFEGEQATLRMALTALLNLLGATDAGAVPAAQLLQGGIAHALAALLQHLQADIRQHALIVTSALAVQPPLARALVEAGAVAHTVAAIRAGGEVLEAGAAALNALLRAAGELNEAAHAQAMAAGAPDALGSAVLHAPTAEARGACASALGALTRGDWRGVHERFGWPVVLVTMQLSGSAELRQLAMEAARGGAALLAQQPATRQSLAADLQALHFLTHALAALALQPEGEAEPLLLRGAAHAVALQLGCGVADLVTEAAATATRLCRGPPAAALMAEAGVTEALVVLLPTVDDAALRASLLGTLTLLLDFEPARAAARAAGAVAVLSRALEQAADSEAQLLASNALAALAHGDPAVLLEAGGAPLLLQLFLAAAASLSPSMRSLADASAPVLLAQQQQPETASAPARSSAPILEQQLLQAQQQLQAQRLEKSQPAPLRGPQASHDLD